MAALVNIPGIASQAIMGLGLFQAMRFSAPQDKAKIIASRLPMLANPIAIFSTQAGQPRQHIGYEFINTMTNMREMYDLAGNILVALPIQHAQQTGGLLFGKMLASIAAAGGAAAGLLGAPLRGEPFIVEDTPEGDKKIEEFLSGPDLPKTGGFLGFGAEQPLGKPQFGPRGPLLSEPPIGTPQFGPRGPLLSELPQTGQDVETFVPPVNFGDPESLQLSAMSDPELLRLSTIAEKEAVIDKLMDPKKRAPPTSSFGPRLPQGSDPPLGPPGQLTPAEMRAANLNRLNELKRQQKQDQAFNRFDSLQTRTSTQRIHNMETPLYDYSQSGSRIRGLELGNNPVII